MTAPTAWAGHVRIVVGEPPAGGAQGLLIAGRGKEVSGSDAARVLAKVPKGACPCPVTIYVTLPREPVHNVRRYRIAIVGDGYHGLLVSSRTKVPGLVSLYDLEPAAKALNRGEKPPLSARPDSNPQETLRRLDVRLTEAHDSRGPASYVVFGLGVLRERDARRRGPDLHPPGQLVHTREQRLRVVDRNDARARARGSNGPRVRDLLAARTRARHAGWIGFLAAALLVWLA